MRRRTPAGNWARNAARGACQRKGAQLSAPTETPAVMLSRRHCLGLPAEPVASSDRQRDAQSSS
eukprot:6415910-Pyramimonas_sp.AAC.1